MNRFVRARQQKVGESNLSKEDDEENGIPYSRPGPESAIVVGRPFFERLHRCYCLRVIGAQWTCCIAGLGLGAPLVVVGHVED